MGRPSDYGPEVAAEILSRLASGETLRAICADEDMPHRRTVHRWLNEHQDFRHHYARAREAQAEAWADEIVEIADSRSMEDTARARLMIDTRKWLMGKNMPKKYSDKASVELAGPGGGPVQVLDVSTLTREQLLALEPVLAALAGPGGPAGEGESGDPEAGS